MIRIHAHNIKIILLLLVGVTFAAYGAYQLRDVFMGPSITIEYPISGAALADDHLVLKGQSADIASLMLNGHQIFTDQQGNFSQDLLLLDGYNVIEVRATDKLKRTTIKHLEIVRTVPPAAVARNRNSVRINTIN